MASPATTTLLSSSRISPPPGSVPDTSVPLTSFDLPWLHSPPVHRLFFYTSTNPNIESLKSSLSLTLQHFFTLASTIRHSPDSDDKLEIYYKDGDAVLLTVAESDDNFNELASGKKRDYLARIHPLVPQPSGLLAVQVTLFPHQGVSIGVTVPHIVGDGSSTVGFLKSWASACRSGLLTVMPVYDRAFITEIPGSYPRMYDQMIRGRPITPVVPSTLPSPSDKAVLASFTLRRDQIARLKQRVVSGELFHNSTFVVCCAYAWVCHVRTRGCEGDQTVHLMFPVNCRGRLDPPVPAGYFGNCLSPCMVEESVGVLKGEEGFVAASVAIGKAVEGLKKGVLRGAEDVGRRIMAISPEKLLSVAGSPKLGVYDVDFGWGRPMRVEVPSIERTGAISLAETREGDGGVEIGLAFEKGKMDEFEKHFYGDLH